MGPQNGSLHVPCWLQSSELERFKSVENIMLSEISQRKTNTVQSHLYVESNEQTDKQNRSRSLDTQNSCQRGGASGGWVKKGEGIKQKKIHTHTHTYLT